MRKKQLIFTISLIISFVSINLQGIFVKPVLAGDLGSSQSAVLANNAPVAEPQSVEAFSGYYTSIILTGSDPDGDPLTFIVVEYPANGTLEDDYAPSVVYYSNIGYEGPDSFQFIVSDGVTESAPATVNITVSANADPVADSQTVVTRQGVDTPITLTGSDADGDALTFILLSYPMNGGLTGTAPDLVYRSRSRFVGQDSFMFLVSDGLGQSAPAIVSITVEANESPVADPQSVEAFSGYFTPIILTGSDPEGDELFFFVTEYPEHGTLEDDFAPSVVYYSDIGYEGSDSFQFIVSDGVTESAPATVNITVSANADPVADSQTVVTRQGVDTPITLTGSDADGDELTFILLSYPMNGGLSGTAPDLVYRSRSNFVGQDSFMFLVSDGLGQSEPATVNITVEANASPLADSQNLEVYQGDSLDIVLTGSDPEGDELFFFVIEYPEHGTLDDEAAPYLTYLPDEGFTGLDSFQFIVSDGVMESDPATVNITVLSAGPETIFWDDFETDQGWVVNPNGIDKARSGIWERAIPEATDYFGPKQLGQSVSGSYNLVTSAKAGKLPSRNDVDYGVTSIRSPFIDLPEEGDITLSLSYYFAHYSDSNKKDFLRVSIVGRQSATVLELTGSKKNVNAAWTEFSTNLNNYAGQRIYILIEAADNAKDSLVEAGIDDVLITVSPVR